MKNQLPNKKSMLVHEASINNIVDNITTKMYAKGTIRIPAAIRNELHLNDGD